jgi:hypothetical protein
MFLHAGEVTGVPRARSRAIDKKEHQSALITAAGAAPQRSFAIKK